MKQTQIFSRIVIGHFQTNHGLSVNLKGWNKGDLLDSSPTLLRSTNMAELLCHTAYKSIPGLFCSNKAMLS